jgi:hypothetical protein
MRTARMLEAEWRQVLQGNSSMGQKEDESSWPIGQVWAAGFHHVMAHSRLTGILKLTNFIFLFKVNVFHPEVFIRIYRVKLTGYFHSLCFLLFHYSTTVNVWDPTTYCSTYIVWT